MLRITPVTPVTLGQPNDHHRAAGVLAFSLALQINVLLAIFNMLPIPPLDGGNVVSGLLPHDGSRSRSTPFARAAVQFCSTYMLMLTGGLECHGRRRRPTCWFLGSSDRTSPRRAPGESTGRRRARRLRHAGRPGRLHLGHLVGAPWATWVPLQDKYELLLFRRRTDGTRSRATSPTRAMLTQFASNARTSPTGSAPGWIPSAARFSYSHSCPSTRSYVSPACRWWCRCRGSERVPTYKEQQETAVDKDICRRSDSLATRCCRPPTWRYATRASCRWARTRLRTWNWRERWCAASTTFSDPRATSSSSHSRC